MAQAGEHRRNRFLTVEAGLSPMMRKLSAKVAIYKGNFSISMQCHLIGYFRRKKYLGIKQPKKDKVLLSSNCNNEDKVDCSWLVLCSEKPQLPRALQTALPVMK